MRRLALVTLIVGAVGVALLTRPPAPPPRHEGEPLLPPAPMLRAAAPAHRQFLADAYWILTLNQIGAASTAAEMRDVFYLADLATDLDPSFAQVYRYAGLALPTRELDSTYRNTDLSTRILEKGVRALPDDRQLAFALAHNYLFFEHRYRDAADIFSRLSTLKDSPPWYGALATRLYAQSGLFDASEVLAAQLRDSAEDEETREIYDHRVREIAQERLLQGIDRAIASFREREGKPPDNIRDLVVTGILPEIPPDPLGGDIYLGPDGRAHASSSRFRLELIVDPKSVLPQRNVNPHGEQPH